LSGTPVGKGAAGAGGVNLLPGAGLSECCVGDGVVDVAVVVLFELGGWPPPQPTVSAPEAMTALQLAASARRRGKCSDFIVVPI
jgi:hypothetical protein